MRFFDHALAPVRPQDIIFGQSSCHVGLGAAIGLAFMATGIYLVTQQPVLGWFWTAFSALLTAFAARRFIRTLSGQNWLLRYRPGTLLVNVRPTWGKSSASDFVVELVKSDIESIRIFHSSTITISAGDRETRKTAFLEIQLRRDDIEPLRERISEAGKPRRRGRITSSVNLPISLDSDGRVRLTWQDVDSVVRPSLAKTLAILASDFPTLSEVNEVNDFTVSSADKTRIDQQIIEFIERGETIPAIKLARSRYGFSLRQAKEFVEGLRK